MSKEQITYYEQRIGEVIPERGQPFYFVHAGLHGISSETEIVHGVTHNNWQDALFHLSDLSSFGEHTVGQQILANISEFKYSLTIEELASLQDHIVFDMNNSKDVNLLREAHYELNKY
jgi:hypothetical protein